MELKHINKDRKNRRKSTPDLSTLVYGKIPPQSKDLEEAVLGILLVDKSAFDTVCEVIRPEVFYVETHQRIYAAIQTLTARNSPVDLRTVVEQLKSSGDLETVGGVYYLAKLTNSVTSGANVLTYARKLFEKFMAREIIRISGEFIGRAYDDSEDVFETMQDLERDVLKLGQSHISTPSLSIDTVLVEAVKRIEHWRSLDTSMTGITSGFKEIDRATRGWQPGDLIIIAARPSVGKTAFALNLARNAAAAGTPVAIYSLEMDAVSQALRMLSAESGLWLVQLQTGRLDDQQMSHLYRKGIQQLSHLPVFIEENTSITISRFKASVRRMHKKYRIGLVIVDYLQLMKGDIKGQIREQEISTISREMKTLAMELKIPIIALSQLSREVEKRANKDPQLSDLRESGAIEQDADLVAFLWSPSEEDVKRDPNLAKKRHFKIAKHRNGILIKEDFNFLNEIQKFTDVPPPELPEGNWKPVPTQQTLPLPSNDKTDMPF